MSDREVELSKRGNDTAQTILDIAVEFVDHLDMIGNTIFTEEFIFSLSKKELMDLYKLTFDNMIKSLDFVRKVSVSKLMLQNSETALLLERIQKLTPDQYKTLVFYVNKVERGV